LGTLADLNLASFKNFAGADIIMVPFKGASPAITALMGGHVEMATSAITPVIDHLRSGEMRGLVISKKFSEFHNIPTLKELGAHGFWDLVCILAPQDFSRSERNCFQPLRRLPEIRRSSPEWRNGSDPVSPRRLFQDWARNTNGGGIAKS
jgi:tripartite-type tricarboxylate transporter receptor subunit TctC